MRDIDMMDRDEMAGRFQRIAASRDEWRDNWSESYKSEGYYKAKCDAMDMFKQWDGIVKRCKGDALEEMSGELERLKDTILLAVERDSLDVFGALVERINAEREADKEREDDEDSQ